jgi:hypothetical protein
VALGVVLALPLAAADGDELGVAVPEPVADAVADMVDVIVAVSASDGMPVPVDEDDAPTEPLAVGDDVSDGGTALADALVVDDAVALGDIVPDSVAVIVPDMVPVREGVMDGVGLASCSARRASSMPAGVGERGCGGSVAMTWRGRSRSIARPARFSATRY